MCIAIEDDDKVREEEEGRRKEGLDGCRFDNSLAECLISLIARGCFYRSLLSSRGYIFKQLEGKRKLRHWECMEPYCADICDFLYFKIGLFRFQLNKWNITENSLRPSRLVNIHSINKD